MIYWYNSEQDDRYKFAMIKQYLNIPDEMYLSNQLLGINASIHIQYVCNTNGIDISDLVLTMHWVSKTIDNIVKV